MNELKPKSKLAIITLVVATLAMIGTVSNSFFIITKYQQERKTIMTISSRFLPNSKVELAELDSPIIGFKKDGYYYELKKVIKFFIECRITNLSSKKVMIEELTWGIKFNGVSVFQPARIYDNKKQPQTLPRLLDTGEQAFYFMSIEWPIDQRVIEEIKTAYPDLINFNLNPTSVGDLYTYLGGKGLDLNYESEGITPRTFCTIVITADGKRFFEGWQKLFHKIGGVYPLLDITKE